MNETKQQPTRLLEVVNREKIIFLELYTCLHNHKV